MPPPDQDREVDLQPYLGRWVALLDGRIVGVGRTPMAARRAARSAGAIEPLEVAYVAGGETPHLQSELPLSSVMARVRRILSRQRNVEVHLVGGAVRDSLLGRTNKDLDFAVQGNAIDLARIVADELGGAFYVLDAERGTARVVLQDHSLPTAGEPIILDFARLRGTDLETDLGDRDFTINAMALPAGLESPTAEAVIDLFGGQADLTDGVVRAVSEDSTKRDPVRCMRAVRHAAVLQGTIEAGTIDQIRKAAPLLPRISAERIRDELVRLLLSPHPAGSIRSLSELGLLEHVLPEFAATRGVTQSLPHTLDVFDHSLRALEQLDLLVMALLRSETPANPPLRMAFGRLEGLSHTLERYLALETAGGRTRRTIVYLAVLLHDIGKPAVRTVEETGRIRFLRHDQVGADLAANRSRCLALSATEVRIITTSIRNHMRPAFLAPAPSGRAVYRFFRDARDAGVDTCLLSLGDGLGRRENLDEREWRDWLDGVATLLEHYFDRYGESISPPALLTGRQLMDALDILPGPEVGRLLELIREAQAAGEVTTREAALILAKGALEAH